MKNTTDLLQDQLNQDKQQCEHHPYLKELTTEQYKANLKKYAYYLQHTFASDKHPQYDFLEYLNNCDCIEQDNATLQDYKKIINGKYKYLYNFYINNIFESYQDKINIIESQDKPQVRLYCYDTEQQKPITIFSDYFINALFGNDAYTPQQFFDRAFANAKNIFTNDAFNELKQLFLNMPNDTIEYEQLTLFDIEEEEQEEQNEILPKLEPLKNHYIKQSNEHQFFNIFMIYFDVLFATNEMIIKNQCGTTKYKIESYADIIKARINDLNQQIDAMQKEYNNIDCLTVSEQMHQAINQATTEEEKDKARCIIFAKYPNWHNDINFLRDIRHIEQVYNKNVNDAIKTIHEDKQKQYNEILKNKPYFDMLCKELLNQDIQNIKERLKKDQTKLDNIAISGTTEFYINDKIEYFKNNMLPKNNLDVVNFDYRIAKTTTNFYTTAYINKVIATNEFANMLHQEFSIEVPYKNSKDKTIVNVQYDVGGTSKEPITYFDTQVHDALCTLIEKHIANYKELSNDTPLLFTEQNIIDAMENYPTYKNYERLEMINASIEKCRRIHFLLDSQKEFSKYYPNASYFTFDKPYMPVKRVRGYVQGNKTDAWICTEMPPFYDYGKIKNQIGQYPTKWLSLGASNTLQNHNRDIKVYIIKRINEFMANDTPFYKCHILIDTIIKECNIDFEQIPQNASNEDIKRINNTNRTKRTRIIKNIESFLNELIKTIKADAEQKHEKINGIYEFKFYSISQNKTIDLIKNQSIIGIEIHYKTNKSTSN